MLGPYPARAVRHAPVGGRKPFGDRGVLGDMRITALLALLAVSAVLAACGGSDSVQTSARRVDRGGQRQEGEGRQRDRRRPGPHALPLHRRGPGPARVHRRLRRRPGRPPLASRRVRACPSTSRRSSAPTAASSSSPTTATPSTATPATGRRPTPTARAWAASGSWSSAGLELGPPSGRKSSDGYWICFMLYGVNAIIRGDGCSTLVRTARRRGGLTPGAARASGCGTRSQAEVAASSAPARTRRRRTLERLLRATGHRARRSARTRPPGSTRTSAARAARADAGRAPRQLRGHGPAKPACPDPGARRVSSSATLSSIRPAALLTDWSTAGSTSSSSAAWRSVLHGSARNTFDLDICFASDPHNLEALGVRARSA